MNSWRTGLSLNPPVACAQEINMIFSRQIAERYSIEKAFDYALEKNTGLGYHNAKHCITVMRMAHRLAMLTDENITPWEVQNLLLAALFHDFGHTGKNPDSANIEIAVAGMKEFLIRTRLVGGLDIEIIEGIIRVTEFPFVHEPSTLIQKIMRDADLMQVLDVDCIETVVHGLRIEIGNKIGREISLEEFCAGQEEFMNSVTLYTDVGKSIYERAKPFVIKAFLDFTSSHALTSKKDSV